VTPEARLFLAVLRPAETVGRDEFVRDAASGVRDWPALLRLAGRHEVGTLLHQGLEGAAREHVPVGILPVLEDHVRRQREQGRRAWSELRAILVALGESGLTVMPFKGPMLAHRLYGDVGARVSHDLDFLIRDEDVPRVLSVLESSGYHEPTHAGLSPAQAAAMRRLYGELAYTKRGCVTVEPHWALAQSTQAIDLDCAAVWRRSSTVDFDGVRMASPEAEDLFLILVVHGSKEVWRLGKWVADVAAFLAREPGLDWRRTLERARAAGILRMTHVAWRLAELLGLEAPTPVRESLRVDETSRRVARAIERRLVEGDTAPLRVDRFSALRWRLRERLRDRWRYAWRTLGTPRPVHFGIVRLPDRWIGCYVPLKIVHDYLYLPALHLLPTRDAARRIA